MKEKTGRSGACAPAAGLHVKRLKRVQEHTMRLGDLPVGAWRDLTEQELKQQNQSNRGRSYDEEYLT